MSISLSLQTIRVCKGFTEGEVAERCGVTIGKIKEFENSPWRMTASIAIKLRKLYGIPIDYFAN